MKTDLDIIIDRLVQSDGVNIHSIIVSKNSEILFKHNYTSNLSDIRSISKTVVSLCIGIAIEMGLKLEDETLTLDTKVWKYFKNKVKIDNTANISKLEKLTIRHLITHTIGHNQGILFRKDRKLIDNNCFLEYAFNYNMDYEPGEYFAYSNAGIFIFSALIQEVLGISLDKWIDDILFQKIGITNYNWDKIGKYCAGATGLQLANDDLYKIGLLLLNKGKYEEKQIISSEWIDELAKPHIRFSNSKKDRTILAENGYSYGVWTTDRGCILCSGTDGQFLIVYPEKQIIVSIVGQSSNVGVIVSGIEEILKIEYTTRERLVE